MTTTKGGHGRKPKRVRRDRQTGKVAPGRRIPVTTGALLVEAMREGFREQAYASTPGAFSRVMV